MFSTPVPLSVKLAIEFEFVPSMIPREVLAKVVMLPPLRL